MANDRAPLSPSAAAPAVVRLSELVGAFSYALDITEGQPEGHCMRSCWIGLHIGRQAGLSSSQLQELYYTILMKDLGCSSNAARICALYMIDDRSFKRDYMSMGDSLPEALAFVLSHAGLKAPLAARFRSAMTVIRGGEKLACDQVSTRCQRGAEIARLLRFPESVAQGIYSLDEHYDGKGRPHRLRGSAIPLYSRIALLAQIVDVFNTSGGRAAALKEVELRAARWFDPEMVHAFKTVASSEVFWEMLDSPGLDDAVLALVQVEQDVLLDDDYLDDIAAAFGQVVDAKSPYTSGHSTRVALYTDLICDGLGLPAARRRWVRRAAALHDLGKLGVSNTVLDKPGALDRAEWAEVQQHATYSEKILERVGAFAELARIVGAHHERLDGKGYPRGLSGDQIPLETRIITAADIFDAITADRPYRGPIPLPEALAMMEKTVGSAIDPAVFAALKAGLKRLPAIMPAAAATPPVSVSGTAPQAFLSVG